MAETKSKPILFSGPMVRAILEGRKTQTRRVVGDANSQGNWKPSECDLSSAFVDPGPSPAGNPGPYLKALVTSEALKAHGWIEDDEIRDRIYPRIFPGDELWVRETWGHRGGIAQCGAPEDRYYDAWIEYKADRTTATIRRGFDDRSGLPKMVCRCKKGGPDEHGLECQKFWASWRPSIFMPRWASRLTLTVKDVRVERLQDISEEDAIAEGCKPVIHPKVWQGYQVMEWLEPPHNMNHTTADGEEPPDWMIEPRPYLNLSHMNRTAAQEYRGLWESINGPGSWDANPWVWVYTFAPHHSDRKEVIMAKSDSTRKPKLPKVWVRFNTVYGVVPAPGVIEAASKVRFKGAHQYAPVQKPRRCIWDDSDGFDYTYCPNCGGRIVRRKS